MTTLLKDVLAGIVDDAELPDVDQKRAFEAGRARLRRRWLGVGAGVGAAVLVAAVAIPLGLEAVDSDSAQPSGPERVRGSGSFVERKVTYAIDSEIHYGDEVISVAPHTIRAFVQNDDGFAFVDGDDVYFTDGEATEKIGVAGAPYGQLLAADDEGSRVAWVDLSSPGETILRTYDSSTGETEWIGTYTKSGGEFQVPSVTAVDGGYVYGWAAESVVRIEPDRHEINFFKGASRNDWLLDVNEGWLAFDDSDPENGMWGDDLVIARKANATGPRYPSGRVEFSPDATYFANDHEDSERIIARDGGDDVTPRLDGYQFMALVQWIDDERFTAVGFANPEDDQLDLLECSVSEGSCETEVRSIAFGDGLALPTGSSIED